MNALDQSSRLRPDINTILGLEKSERPTLFLRWRTQIIAAAVIAIGIALPFLWGSSGSNNAVRYVTEPAVRGDLTVIVAATGTVQPINKVDVSSELSGTIRRVLVDYNSKVTEGQALAELDTDKLRATADSSRAKLVATRAKVKDAEATLTEKKLEFERKSELSERRIASDRDLEAAKAAYDRALASLDSTKADVASAEADLKLNETNLAKSCICSPINGIVLSRAVEPGQTVASNLQAPVLFTLAEDLAKMEVRVDVDEADVGQVKEGQSATFSVDAHPDKTFTARIRELRYGSETVQGVVTYKAVLSTDNTDLLLRPGMTATAEIKVQEVKDAVSVPNAALRFSPVGNGVSDTRSFLQRLLPGPPPLRPASEHASSGPDRKIWVLTDSQASEVAVKVGASDGKRTQIVEGAITPGQAVIVDIAGSGK